MNEHPRAREDVVFRPVGTEWVAYDPSSAELHVMNVTAALVWEMCDGETSVDEMMTLLEETLTDVPSPDALLGHVRDALRTFEEKGLLT